MVTITIFKELMVCCSVGMSDFQRAKYFSGNEESLSTGALDAGVCK